MQAFCKRSFNIPLAESQIWSSKTVPHDPDGSCNSPRSPSSTYNIFSYIDLKAEYSWCRYGRQEAFHVPNPPTPSSLLPIPEGFTPRVCCKRRDVLNWGLKALP